MNRRARPKVPDIPRGPLKTTNRPDRRRPHRIISNQRLGTYFWKLKRCDLESLTFPLSLKLYLALHIDRARWCSSIKRYCIPNGREERGHLVENRAEGSTVASDAQHLISRMSPYASYFFMDYVSFVSGFSTATNKNLNLLNQLGGS